MHALALGAPFDPAVHEAMREGDDGSYPPGSIARVLEDGYITCRSRRRREAPLE
jgi:molecular chaperone GrpE (heat shock protein)